MVTAIIPVYNRPHELARLLESMEFLTLKPNKILIVDDYSSQSIVVGSGVLFGIPLIVINLNTHVGTALAKNVALGVVETEYVWFLDSDCVIDKPHCLSNMVYYLKKNPRVGAVGGEMHMINGERLMSVKELYPNMNVKQSYTEILDHLVQVCKLDYVIDTNNMLTRSDLLRKAGGFQDVVFGEDHLYCLWLRKNGYLLIEDEDFGVIHEKVSSCRQGSYFKWELSRAFNQMKVSILALPWYKLLFFPVIDIYSNFLYLQDRRKRLKFTQGENKFQMYNIPKLLKGLVYLAVWGLSYFYGVWFLVRKK